MDIKARVPGVVTKICVAEGDEVKKGDIVMIMEAMKMETKVPCPCDGEVTEIKVEEKDHVKGGQVLMTVE